MLVPIVAVLAVAMHFAVARAADDNPCAKDLEKFCSSIPVGGSKRLVCLQEHSSDLSSECQAYLNKRQPRRRSRQQGDNLSRAWTSACADDIKRLCSGIAAGPGVIRHCLDQNEASLSPNCKTARAAVRKPS